MPAIDKVVFAKFCLIHANFCGVSTHYLVAVAQLRSQISDDIVDGKIGPFRFAQEEWDQNRKNPEFEPDFESGDINSWRMQCAVVARMVNGTLDALTKKNGGEVPGVLDLYFGQLAETQTAAQQDQIAADLRAALQDTASAVVRAGATPLDDITTPAEPEATPQTILFRRLPGVTPVRGHLVVQIQNALVERGHLPPISAMGKPNNDGIFGSGTENAIEAWQTSTGHPSTGALTQGEWRELTGLPAPDIYERCAQITGAFEGTGFGGTNATNFDNTVLTFGYHGYTLTGGNLQAFLKEMDEKHPGLLEKSFGAAKAEQLRTLFPPVSVATARTLGTALFLSGDTVKDDWRQAFTVFGETPEVQTGQLGFSRRVYWSVAEKMRAILKLSEPLSHALCFDVAVQNGDKSTLARTTADAFTAAMGETDRRVAFGQSIANASLAQFQNDVRQRKVETLGRGSGTVHGDEYRLVNWGFADSESAESNDSPDPIFPSADNSSFSAFFASQFPGLTAFSANEFLVKGAKNALNHLNTDPPKVLWPNIVKTVRVLLELKQRLGGPAITLNSVYRSPAYNVSVGGALNSQHMKFRAVDIVAHDGTSPSHWHAVLKQMRNENFFQGGIGLYSSFVHVDTRGYNADWA
ncbi:MAG TPA: D-Ala-D-Ala carboxypeptidase family metallohydrolase [Bradyrhizobium sp.]|jgi:peptidoglycan hydrolase-like protein with peptidoglycan-binding domain|nr:D-Ala-D-Ala carboxypeptidase family metallohydrolase [Bradyrhizobium sp.]